MKRDLDLLRNILLMIEADEGNRRITISSFDAIGFDPMTVSAHIELLQDAGYIECERFNSMGQSFPDYIVKRITMNGHDYLSSVRNETVWQEIKAKLKEFAASAPLDVIKSLGSSILLKLLGV